MLHKLVGVGIRAQGLLFALALAGCASAIADGDGVAPGGGPRAVPVFVASTRGGDGAAPAAGQSRHSITTVTVPPGHEPGRIERPTFGGPDRNHDFTVLRSNAIDETGFSNEIAARLSGRIGSNRDILIYVHGFNTSLEEARFRVAQIVVDGGFNGIPVLFTWPSRGSLLAYGSDRESAMASRDALTRLLAVLSHVPDVGRVHVLAHSMGAWLAMEALRESAIAGHPDLDGHLGDVLLAAPDIDLDVFRQQMARLGSAHVAIFAASNDRALYVSSLLADRPRLGALDPSNAADRKAIEGLGVKVIDLSHDSVGWIGHGTYAAAPAVVRGIGLDITAPRAEDRDTQAVLDGTKGGPVSAADSIETRPLPPPAPAPAAGALPAPATAPAPAAQ